jgi:hypothetical protein
MNRNKADIYNRTQAQLHTTPRHLTELTALAQEAIGLEVDGMLGPKTRAALEEWRECSLLAAAPPRGPELMVSRAGNLLPGRSYVIDRSWHGGLMNGPPIGIVVHSTQTDPGTAENMAKRRVKPYDLYEHGRGKSSWHITIDADGSILQMLECVKIAYHCRRTPQSDQLLLRPPNHCTIGIELVGYYGQEFWPEVQVEAAERVWRALVSAYPIVRGRAMLRHSELDPTRRSDPGPAWPAGRVLDYAYAA